MTRDMTGGCQCGRVRYVVTIHDDDAYLCHCRMCQRATGGVSIAFKGVARSNLRWIPHEPERFRSSPIAQRGFCRECGTPLTYEGDGADHLDLTVGSFDDPSAFRPGRAFGYGKLASAVAGHARVARQPDRGQ
ncbi:GFA family protein [Sphingomonas sp. Leaf343]|uniref:GFA family protein n=1 Tax=Sphingomonas sp. Leaf343 TaxID=1736345 RepID=UPI000B23B362|nr:GFA family protein [Sphingomonas sp. Leaf343]